MEKKFKELEIVSGQRFNNLAIIKEVDKFVQPSGQTQRGFLCKCDCGNKKIVRLSHLVHNQVRSCGCLNGERHGGCGTQLHNTYRGMKNRCYNENYPKFQNYGGRGIGICDEWLNSYSAFREFALNNGYEDGLWIDRIDNEKGYSPDNCRFVDSIESVNNRRNTFYVNYNGKKISFMMLIRDKGLVGHETAIRCRILRGWNHNEAIDVPIRKGNYYTTERVKQLKCEKGL